MKQKSEPWYIHVGLSLVIVILGYILVQVVFVQPKEEIDLMNYYTNESHLRMDGLRQAEILWNKNKGRFTDNLDSLIDFIENDTNVIKVVNGWDSTRNKSTNPFKSLTSGVFNHDSLFFSPKTHSRYILKVDTNVNYDSVVDRRGRLKKIDTVITIGKRYYIECPDGYGTIGDIEKDALLNAASWE